MKTFMNSLSNTKTYGPYSHTVTVENFFFTSGQIFVEYDEKLKKFPNLYDQTFNTLKKIKTLLIHENFKISDIIKTTIFTTQLNNLEIINTAYKKFFKKYTTIYPARSCVGVSQLPYDALVEIEVIAHTKRK
ncbi:RidA family protein [Buchnera aphidicola]|uniref:2-iminobutanoate/2-iminopropanoate deaminase n=1 Tax=Buchnera aphidicola subsp. Tuberolachnus salignus TaxID=98804 RepID=A0A161K9S1_BUCTT|nr:RidA family protein [Buchnera aphidicola]CUR53219.1 2-iminobutanoate/2-iminopropanoate deaminase [Buchnera aphidicola (Tuberolachnus salignus)]